MGPSLSVVRDTLRSGAARPRLFLCGGRSGASTLSRGLEHRRAWVVAWRHAWRLVAVLCRVRLHGGQCRSSRVFGFRFRAVIIRSASIPTYLRYLKMYHSAVFYDGV